MKKENDSEVTRLARLIEKRGESLRRITDHYPDVQEFESWVLSSGHRDAFVKLDANEAKLLLPHLISRLKHDIMGAIEALEKL